MVKELIAYYETKNKV